MTTLEIVSRLGDLAERCNNPDIITSLECAAHELINCFSQKQINRARLTPAKKGGKQ